MDGNELNNADANASVATGNQTNNFENQPTKPSISGGFPVNTPVEPPKDNSYAPSQPSEGQEISQTPENEHSVGESHGAGDIAPQEKQAAEERLRQQNARQARLLSSLGIDPLSDIAEQLEQGLITEDMVVQHVMQKRGLNPQQVNNQQNNAVPDRNDPVAQAKAAYEAAKQACHQEGKENGQVSFEALERRDEAFIQLQNAMEESFTQRMRAEEKAQAAQKNVDAVLSVGRSGEYYNQLPDDLKQISDFVHVATTAVMANQEASQMGFDPDGLSQKQCQYFANKNSKDINRLAEYLIEIGRRQALQPNQAAQPQNQPGRFVPGTYPQTNSNINQRPMGVAPTGPSGNPAGVPDLFSGVNLKNHKDLARKYARTRGLA